MRFPTYTNLIAATVATSLAVGQPGQALTADEKRENSRLSKAWNVSIKRETAELRFEFAEKCETAFAAGEPMPEPDVRITEEVKIAEDLIDMTVEEISEQYGLASDANRAARKSMNDCILKYRKRNDGS